MDVAVREHLFTAGDLEKLAVAGVVPPDVRTELVDGRLLELTPLGPRHGAAVMRLQHAIAPAVRDTALVSVQNSLMLSEMTVLVPDLALLAPREDFYENSLPTPDDVFLVIEVSHTTRSYDRAEKLPRYAEAAVRELWIVDLERGQVEQFTEPKGSGYESARVHVPGDSIAPFSDHIADARIDVGWLLEGKGIARP